MNSSTDFLQQLLLAGALVCALMGIYFLISKPLRWLSKERSLAAQDDHPVDESDGDDADENEELCSNCGYDARGLVNCPECGHPTPKARRLQLAKLRNDWPTEHIKMRLPEATEEPRIVLSTDNHAAARLLRQHLTARGIRARISVSERLPGALRAAAKQGYRLNVWSEDEERAKAIIDHLWPKDLRE